MVSPSILYGEALTNGVRSFIGMRAKELKALLDAGGAVDAALEDELLGTRPPEKPSLKRALSKGDRRVDSTSSSGGASNGDDDHDGDEGKMDPAMMMAMMASLMPGGGGSSSGGADAVVMGPMKESSYSLKKDKLNLSGLLNVLDGVVDTPGRIIGQLRPPHCFLFIVMS